MGSVDNFGRDQGMYLSVAEATQSMLKECKESTNPEHKEKIAKDKDPEMDRLYEAVNNVAQAIDENASRELDSTKDLANAVTNFIENRSPIGSGTTQDSSNPFDSKNLSSIAKDVSDFEKIARSKNDMWVGISSIASRAQKEFASAFSASDCCVAMSSNLKDIGNVVSQNSSILDNANKALLQNSQGGGITGGGGGGGGGAGGDDFSLDEGSGGGGNLLKGVSKFTTYLAVLTTGLKKTAGLINKVFDDLGVGLDQIYSGALTNAVRFEQDIRKIVHAQKGFGNLNREIEQTYNNISESVLASGAKRAEYAALYAKNLQKGVPHLSRSDKLETKGLKRDQLEQKLMKMQARSIKSITTSAINTSKLLGMDAGTTNEIFMSWNHQLGLGSEAMGEMGRHMQTVAKQSGVTGDELASAMKSADGVMKALKKSGVVSTDVAKAINSFMVSAQKFGLEGASEIMNALGSREGLYESKQSNFLLQSASRADDSGKALQNLKMGTTLTDPQGMKNLMTGVNTRVMELLTPMEENLNNLGINLEDIDAGNLDDVIQKLQKGSVQEQQMAVALQSQFKQLGMEVGEVSQFYKTLEESSKTHLDRTKSYNEQLANLRDAGYENSDEYQRIQKLLQEEQLNANMDALGRLTDFSSELAKSGGRIGPELEKQMVSSLEGAFGSKDLAQDFVRNLSANTSEAVSNLSDKMDKAGLDFGEKLAVKGFKSERDFTKALQMGDKDAYQAMQEMLQETGIDEQAMQDPLLSIERELIRLNNWLESNLGGMYGSLSNGFTKIIYWSSQIAGALFSIASILLGFKFLKGLGLIPKMFSGLSRLLPKSLRGALSKIKMPSFGGKVAKTAASGADDVVRLATNSADDAMKVVANSADDVAKNSNLFGRAAESIDKSWKTITSKTTQAWKNISWEGGKAWRSITELSGNAWKTITSKTTQAWKNISWEGGKAWRSITEFAKNSWSKVASSADDAMRLAASSADDVARIAASGADDAARLAASGADDAARIAASGADDAARIAASGADDAMRLAVSGADDVVKSASFLSKAGGMLSKAGAVLGKVSGPLQLAIGGITGFFGAEEHGRTKTEGTVLGALTGGAETGSMFSGLLGVEKGSTGDKALGVAGAAGYGAMAGSAIGTLLAPITAGISIPVAAGIGAAVGGITEIFKIVTEGTTLGGDLFKGIFAPLYGLYDILSNVFGGLWKVVSGIFTLDIGKVFSGIGDIIMAIPKAIYNTVTRIGKMILAIPQIIWKAITMFVEAVPSMFMGLVDVAWSAISKIGSFFLDLPGMIIKGMATAFKAVLYDFPKWIYDSITGGLASLASSEWLAPIVEPFQEVFKLIGEIGSTIMAPIYEIGNMIYGVFEPVLTMFSDIKEALFGASEGGSFFSSIISSIGWVFKTVGKVLGTILQGVTIVIGALIKVALTPLIVTLKAVSYVVKNVGTVFKWLLDTALWPIKKVLEGISWAVGKVSEGLSWFGDALWTNIGEPISNFFQGMYDSVGWLFNASWGDIGTAMWDGITGIFENLGQYAYDLFIQPWADIGTWIWDHTIGALLNMIPDWVKNLFGGGESVRKDEGGGSIMGEAGETLSDVAGGAGRMTVGAGSKLMEGNVVGAAGEVIGGASDIVVGAVDGILDTGKAILSAINPLNWFEKGTPKVEKSGIGVLHKDEMIIPANTVKDIRAEGSGPFLDSDVTSLLKSPMTSLFDGFTGAINNVVSGVGGFISNISQGNFSDAAKQVVDTQVKGAKAVAGGIANVMSYTPVGMAADFIFGKDSIKKGMDGAIDYVGNITKDFAGIGGSVLEGDIGGVTDGIGNLFKSMLGIKKETEPANSTNLGLFDKEQIGEAKDAVAENAMKQLSIMEPIPVTSPALEDIAKNSVKSPDADSGEISQLHKVMQEFSKPPIDTSVTNLGLFDGEKVGEAKEATSENAIKKLTYTESYDPSQMMDTAAKSVSDSFKSIGTDSGEILQLHKVMQESSKPPIDTSVANLGLFDGEKVGEAKEATSENAIKQLLISSNLKDLDPETISNMKMNEKTMQPPSIHNLSDWSDDGRKLYNEQQSELGLGTNVENILSDILDVLVACCGFGVSPTLEGAFEKGEAKNATEGAMETDDKKMSYWGTMIGGAIAGPLGAMAGFAVDSYMSDKSIGDALGETINNVTDAGKSVLNTLGLGLFDSANAKEANEINENELPNIFGVSNQELNNVVSSAIEKSVPTTLGKNIVAETSRSLIYDQEASDTAAGSLGRINQGDTNTGSGLDYRDQMSNNNVDNKYYNQTNNRNIGESSKGEGLDYRDQLQSGELNTGEGLNYRDQLQSGELNTGEGLNYRDQLQSGELNTGRGLNYRDQLQSGELNTGRGLNYRDQLQSGELNTGRGLNYRDQLENELIDNYGNKVGQINPNPIDYSDEIKGTVDTMSLSRFGMETAVGREKYGSQPSGGGTAILPSMEAVSDYLNNVQLTKLNEMIDHLSAIRQNTNGSKPASGSVYSETIGANLAGLPSGGKSQIKSITKDLNKGAWPLNAHDFADGETDGFGGIN